MSLRSLHILHLNSQRDLRLSASVSTITYSLNNPLLNVLRLTGSYILFFVAPVAMTMFIVKDLPCVEIQDGGRNQTRALPVPCNALWERYKMVDE